MLHCLGQQLGNNKFEMSTLLGFKMEFITSSPGADCFKMLSTNEVCYAYIDASSCAYYLLAVPDTLLR